VPLQTTPVSVAVIGEGRWYIRSTTSGEELYDFRRDPKQLHNLAERDEGELEHVRELEYFRELSHERAQYRAPTEFAEDYKQIEERLKQLGYAGR
jgi:hypothetical protein